MGEKWSNNKRLQEITEQLRQKGSVKAADLAEQFNVSMETIRKDLSLLELRGIAKKEYGGASLSSFGVEKTGVFRNDREEEKRKIGKMIADLAKEYNSMILDAGTTCLACVPFLNQLPGMDIFTVSLEAAELLDGNVHNVFVLPGKKRQKNDALVGNWTEQFLTSIHVDLCILGTAGIMDSRGPTSHSYQELTMKQIMIEHSDLVYVAADTGKFSENGLHEVTGWDRIDGIITCSTLSQKAYHSIEKETKLLFADL